MNEQLSINKCLEESWDLVQDLRQLLYGPDSDGTRWSQVGSGPGNANAILYYFRTPFFNRIQRWQAQYLAKTNSFAISAVENLVNMVIGQGFEFRAKNASQQNKLDEWLKRNKYHQRSRTSFYKLLVDGESFYRIFGDELRHVDADHVYDQQGSGIITSPDDYEDVQAYVINQQRVPADEIQHRALKWPEEKRGTSILFAIIQHLVNAEMLTFNMCRSIDQQVRFAAIRTHESPQGSVELFKAGIQATQASMFGPEYSMHSGGGHENIERYEAGTILDLPTNVKMEFPSSTINGTQAVHILRATLRLCAARVGLPENVLSQDQDSMGAYSASLVADSHCVKGLESWQQRLIDWDTELLERLGFEDVVIIPPDCAIHDKDTQIKQGEFLLRNKVASKQTVGKSFEIDYEEEKPMIEKDVAEDPNMQGSDEENGDDGLDNGTEDNDETT